jgi:hypothetical protein
LESPEEILENALRRVEKATTSGYSVPFISDIVLVELVELISRNPQNRAAVRLVLSCTLAKASDSSRDARMPYTEIDSEAAFSGRTYDERYIRPFSLKYHLPVNDTTAFLTPALRNRNTVLTPELNLVGRPPIVYQAALKLLDGLQKDNITSLDLLAELLRWLILIRDEKKVRLELLLRGVYDASLGEIPLSVEEIIVLLEQHLQSPNSSRLPVLIVAAAYQTGGVLLGEEIRDLESHNAADKQTGSVGDIEVILPDDNNVITGYEMKMRKITVSDVEIALNKILQNSTIQNYVFITTEYIDKQVQEYARSLYAKTGGREISILDCLSFARYFLHFFYRRRLEFVNTYQKLILEQPDSAVPQSLKESWLALRQAAELRPETMDA